MFPHLMVDGVDGGQVHSVEAPSSYPYNTANRLFDLDVGYILRYKFFFIKNYIYTPAIQQILTREKIYYNTELDIYTYKRKMSI